MAGEAITPSQSVCTGAMKAAWAASQPDLREAIMEEDRMARLANELARRDTSTTKHVDLKCQGVKTSQCSYADTATVERMHM